MLTSSNKHLKPILYHENLLPLKTQTMGSHPIYFPRWGLAICRCGTAYLFGSKSLSPTIIGWQSIYSPSLVKNSS